MKDHPDTAKGPKVPVLQKLPAGLRKCRECARWRGTARARELCWYLGPFPEPDPEAVFTLSCLCEGVRCPRCNRPSKIRPGANTYDRERNELIHVPFSTADQDCPKCLELGDWVDGEFVIHRDLVHGDECTDHLEECEACGSCGEPRCLCQCQDYCWSCAEHLEVCSCDGPHHQ